jgi:hypothetical protein
MAFWSNFNRANVGTYKLDAAQLTCGSDRKAIVKAVARIVSPVFVRYETIRANGPTALLVF